MVNSSSQDISITLHYISIALLACENLTALKKNVIVCKPIYSRKRVVFGQFLDLKSDNFLIVIFMIYLSSPVFQNTSATLCILLDSAVVGFPGSTLGFLPQHVEESWWCYWMMESLQIQWCHQKISTSKTTPLPPPPPPPP